MNKHLLDKDVQQYIHHHVDADVHKIALSKSPFSGVTSVELAGQIAARKKSRKKLPLWYARQNIYYPPLLSVEQCSSERTAQYKAQLALPGSLIDLTGGFGVDSLYFSKIAAQVTHCEINKELSEIAAHNFKVLGVANVTCITGDGLDFLQHNSTQFDTIYLDPARRSEKGKVVRLEDCTPDITKYIDLLLSKAKRVIVKTAPLLDISLAVKSLNKVSEVHIVSVKNECKELLLLIERAATSKLKTIAVTLNDQEKRFTFYNDQQASALFATGLKKYLYEPDAALLKSGAFDLIAERYQLEKLHEQTQLYTSDQFSAEFPGRILNIKSILPGALVKKEKKLSGNVIVRNFRETPEVLIKKHKIKPDEQAFLIFTQSKTEGYILIKAEILQYY